MALLDSDSAIRLPAVQTADLQQPAVQHHAAIVSGTEHCSARTWVQETVAASRSCAHESAAISWLFGC